MNKQKRKRNGAKKFIKFLHIVLISVKYLFKILQVLKSIFDLFQG